MSVNLGSEQLTAEEGEQLPANADAVARATLDAPDDIGVVDRTELNARRAQAGGRRAPRLVTTLHGTDVTIATHSYMCRVADAAADALAASGISCEIVDLRSLNPLDVATVAASAARTGALLTLEEGQLTCGVGAEVLCRVQEQSGALRSARVGAAPAPVSSNPVLEAACLPDAGRVARAVRRLLLS